MIKKNLKSLLLLAFVAVCFSSNLSAMQGAVTQKTEEPTSKTDNTFIREFVATMKSDKISYDGKTLTLYAVSRPYEYFVAIVDLAIFTSLLGKSLSIDDKNVRLICSSMFLILDLIGLFLLCKNLHYDRSKVPFLIINDREIKFWDGKSIKWKNVDKILCKNISESNGQYLLSYYIFELCDKFLNALFVIRDRNWNSPIHPDNLFAILEHYLNENKTNLKSEIEALTCETIEKYSSKSIKSA